MLFEELVPSQNLEHYEIEFKGIISEGPTKDGKGREELGWLKEVAAFANTFGGVLYIGVDNKTHEVLSLSHNDTDRIALMIQRLIQIHIEPPIRYKIEKIEVPLTSPTRYVLALHVEKKQISSCFVSYEWPKYYFRSSFWENKFGKRRRNS